MLKENRPLLTLMGCLSSENGFSKLLLYVFVVSYFGFVVQSMLQARFPPQYLYFRF